MLRVRTPEKTRFGFECLLEIEVTYSKNLLDGANLEEALEVHPPSGLRYVVLNIWPARVTETMAMLTRSASSQPPAQTPAEVLQIEMLTASLAKAPALLKDSILKPGCAVEVFKYRK